MKSIFIFLALVALSQGVPFKRSLDGRIVNGVEAEEGQIPYQVSLQDSTNFHFCGGSIINENWVVTAAHCVQYQSPRSVKVVVGTINLNDPKSIHHAAEIIVHADYDPRNSWINDIALIKVNEKFHFSKTVSPAILPNQGDKVAAHSTAVVSGWGDDRLGGNSPKELFYTEIEITTVEYCRDAYHPSYPIHDTHICAHDRNVEAGSCHGDSGGPLTVEGTLVGLVSWAQGCASTKYPTVYTRVSGYIDWIKSHAV